eukprot:503524_1
MASEESKTDSKCGCAIIVGVGPGMGRSLGLRFAKAGYNIALISRNKDKLQPFAKEITDKYKSVNVLCCSADTSNQQQCEAAFKEITDKNAMGRVEILVFNASYRGLSWPMPGFLDLDIKHYDASFQVGAKGAFIWAQLVLPDMLKNENKTSILITGATASMRGSAKFSAFASTKFALRALCQSLAREFAPKGVHCAHFIIDGMIMNDKEKIEKNDNGKKMNPNDIADTYYFVHQQPQSAWVQELDLRPDVEKF